MVWDWNTESFVQITESMQEEIDDIELGSYVGLSLTCEQLMPEIHWKHALLGIV